MVRLSTNYTAFLGNALLALALSCLSNAALAQAFEHKLDVANTPWTHEAFDSGEEQFTFAVFSDLYGGERAGIFSTAIAQINLLRPALILSVGDLIDGGTEDRSVLQSEWAAFDAKLERATAPVFVVGGNHDLTNATMREVWIERYGARYYYFVYRDVLFLMLDSEDYSAERMAEIYRERAAYLTGDPDSQYGQMPERLTGAVSAEQATFFTEVLRDHPDVRWTFLLMHKPVWRNPDATNFQAIETALADRSYTVINGHFHTYSRVERLGRDYLTLATTGGGQNAKDDMAFDHVTLVTMDDAGPTIVNLRLDGILDKNGEIPLGADERCFQASRCGTDEK